MSESTQGTREEGNTFSYELCDVAIAGDFAEGHFLHIIH